jgi:hypothetical protein
VNADCQLRCATLATGYAHRYAKSNEMSMSDSDYIKGIKSTGFGLEYTVSKNLVENGWTVINNKYYIDDVQGSAREIDILAYKATLQKWIQIYTVLIISCKKSSKNAWAFLAKEKKENDPNIDWNPVTIWSNQKVLRFMIENYDWKTKYVNSSRQLNESLFLPQKHIFAFQELHTKNGKAQNDKAIFNSVVSSMKSQDYEIASLEKRKKESSLYNFNLISVVDAPLLRINYGDIEPSIEHIDSDIYVGSYIINKKETLSRVHFVKSDIFPASLKTYNLLHEHNIDQASVIFESYYIDCIKDQQKVKLFLNDFNRDVKYEIYKAIRGLRTDKKLKNVTDIIWNEKKGSAAISVDDVWEDAEIDALNKSPEVTNEVRNAFKKIYRYEGNFYFDMNIPF